MINFCLKNIWNFLFSLTLFTFLIFAIAEYIDRKHPFKPSAQFVFGHIEISVERPIEIEIERPSPTPMGPDFV